MAESKQDEDSKDTSNSKKGHLCSPNWTQGQVLTAVSLSFLEFTSQVSFSIIAPFFPVEAGKKGLTATEIGFIFGIFKLVTFVTSPIYGLFVSIPVRTWIFEIYVSHFKLG